MAKPKSELRLSRAKKLLFATIIFLLFLVVLEGALRLLGLPPALPDLREDQGLVRESNSSIEYEYTPGWSGYHVGAITHINSLGWRGKEFSMDKPGGVIRILGIGDSFTFGRAVDDEDIFLAKLESMLNQDGGITYEAINAGHENVNTVKELQYFEEQQMLRLKPDAVLLGFTVHNDAQRESNRRLYRQYKRTASWPLRAVNSDSFKYIGDRLRLARILRSGVEWAYNDHVTDLYYKLILSNYEDGSKSWRSCRKALLGFRKACQSSKVPLVVALFPVYTKEVDQTYRDYPEDFRNIHDKVKSVLADEEGVKVIDMLEPLADSGLTIEEIRVPIDGHPNRVWHEIVARQLHKTIKEMGLKPASVDQSGERRD